MCRGFCARWRLTRSKYSGVGSVPEPNAGALGGVADEFDTGVLESGTDESEICRCSRGQSCLSFYSVDCTYTDFTIFGQFVY